MSRFTLSKPSSRLEATRGEAKAMIMDRSDTALSELWFQSCLLAQLVGSDSVKDAVSLDGNRPFPIGID